MRPFTCAFIILICVAGAASAQRQVAITFDDLPVRQSGEGACDYSQLSAFTQRLLEPFHESTVPLTAFVIANNCPELTADQRRIVLRMWTSAGVELGNHTYSHRGLNNTPVGEYEEEILRADAVLEPILGGDPLRYFRSPMLQTGPTREIKERLERFLANHDYQQAPVTFDNSDWMFALVYSAALARGDKQLAERVREEYIPYMESVIAFFEDRAVEVVGREFPHVLLLHANYLNAEMAQQLLEMLRKRVISSFHWRKRCRTRPIACPMSTPAEGVSRGCTAGP